MIRRKIRDRVSKKKTSKENAMSAISRSSRTANIYSPAIIVEVSGHGVRGEILHRLERRILDWNSAYDDTARTNIHDTLHCLL